MKAIDIVNAFAILTWIVGTLINVNLTIFTGETRYAFTLIIVVFVDASGAVLARLHQLAFINIWFG
jgi:hypothetical protein